ncbi:MAG: alpha/beta fold hydrolase [Chloroflexi bacterium]|nr:alpha/beta fold hydrolase [Chloroflexota bacterium]
MRTRLIFLLVLLTGGLISCGQNDQPEVEVAETAVPTTIPEPTDVMETAVPTTIPEPTDVMETAVPTTTPFIPTFAESECPFELPADVPDGEVVCGYVTVPEDHQQPDGATIRIAIAHIKDQSDDHQPDPVIVLSGGPGQKTLMDTVAIAQILEPFHPHRDLILFDQRGVGSSEPSLDCPEFVDALFDNLDESNPSMQAQSSYNAILACRDRLVAAGHNLSVFTTWQNSADVDAIRVALGYEAINLYGGSYGSHLAQAVMRDHPNAIRSVIIDSVYPLEASLFVDVATSSATAIQHLLDVCAEDEACHNAYPNLEEALFAIVDQLNAEPLPITITNPVDGNSYDSFLTGEVVVQNLRTFLYDTMAIPLLPQAIFDVHNGDYELMTRLTSIKLARFDRLSTGMEISVICTDDLIGKTPQDMIDNLAALPPQLAGNTNPDDIRSYGIFAICSDWPIVEAESWVKEPVVSDIPTLVLSGEFDPVTPPKYAQEAAEHLSNSYVYEFSGVGHNPVGGSSCARDMVAEFLSNPNGAPDASCMTDIDVSFVVPTDYDVMARESIYIEAHGVSAQVPQGWTQVEPGIFTSPDFTQVLYIVSLGSDLDAIIAENEMTGPVDEVEINGRIWTYYTFQPSNPDAIGIDAITIGDDGTVYDVAIITPPEQQDEMQTNVQLPAMEAFAIGDVPMETAVDGAVQLISYSSQTFHISGMVPQGWTEAAPGIFQRGQDAGDPTALIQKSYPDMTVEALNTLLLPQLGLSELPDPIEVVETAVFSWDVYHIEIDVGNGRFMVVEIAQDELDGVSYMVLLQAFLDEFESDAFHESIFMPTVEALLTISE